MRSRWLRLLAALFALTLVAAACGDDDGEETTDTTEGDGGEDDGGEDGGEVEPGPGFDGETITLGVVTPQTGVAAVIGNPLTNGNQVFFDALNEEGGIAGQYPVELEIVDSQYQESVGVQQYNSIKNDVVAFVQILGTAVTNAILPQLESDGIVAGPASLDSFWVPEPNLMHIGSPYQLEAINAMDYYFNQQGNDPADTTVCVMHQDDPYGEAGLAGVEFAGEQMGFEVAETATFAATDTDFSAQVNQMQGSGCELIFLVSLPSATGSIMGTAAQLDYTPQWIGESPTWVSILAQSEVAPYMQEHFLLAAQGPEWGDTSSPGMAQMLEDIEQYSPDQDPDIYFAFGYAQAWTMTQILEQAVEQGDLSQEGIIDAMANVGTVEVGGLLGDYEYGPPEERMPPRVNTIFAVNPEAPGGLEAVAESFTSEAAEAFEFDFG